jgi:tRNA U34 5-methylaminomethyl-2-thiouridine-forming methyltransferase MnmC
MAGGEQGEGGLDWRDGIVPVSRRFDDPYFSLADGLAETRHVFLAGNGLPGRLCDGFRVAELGFGTGLNLLALWIAWQGLGAPGVVRFTSFEAFPLAVEEMARALAAFPEAAAVAGPLLDQWSRGAWDGVADAWFLDGFSPAKNPELWSDDLMAEVAAHTAPGGTFATYTAAGHVRRALEAAGFAVERRAGHGRKRHMTAGVLR